MYVCTVCVCIYIYIYMYTHTHTHTRTNLAAFSSQRFYRNSLHSQPTHACAHTQYTHTHNTHTGLAAFPSQRFYGNSLHSQPTPKERPLPVGFPWPNADVPVAFVNVGTQRVTSIQQTLQNAAGVGTSNGVSESSNGVLDSTNGVSESSNGVFDSSNGVLDSANGGFDDANGILGNTNGIFDSSNGVSSGAGLNANGQAKKKSSVDEMFGYERVSKDGKSFGKCIYVCVCMYVCV
jgi:hypothetical protein